MKKILISSLILGFSLFTAQASFAEDYFPLTLEPEIIPKTFSVNLLYSDSFLYNNSMSNGEFRLEVKTHFLNKGTGIVSEILAQHLSGNNPAIMSNVIAWGESAHTNDFSGLIGYRFAPIKEIGLTPYLKARGIITRGKGGDNLYGAELGGNFEWIIYPETTHLNLRYGAMIPLIHRYTGQADTVSPTSLLLSNLEAQLSYRFLENWDVIVGYQMRNFPKYQGASSLKTNDLVMWNSVILGLAYVF